MNKEELLTQFLGTLPEFSQQELGMLQQIVARQEQSTRVSSSDFNKAFELPALNVPAEFLVNYHQYFFQSFIQEIFNPYEGFYNPSDPDQLTNDSSVKVSSSWNDTDIKTGQNPHVIVDCDGVQLSPFSLGDVSANAVPMIGNVERLNSACTMDIGMLFQVVASRPQEATNLANIILVSIAKTRKIIRELFGLYHVTYPSMSPAAPMDGSPSEKFIASIRFSTTKHVYWHETITHQTFRNIIYRLVGVCDPKDNEPLVQMVLGSDLKLDPKLAEYLRQVGRI